MLLSFRQFFLINFNGLFQSFQEFECHKDNKVEGLCCLRRQLTGEGPIYIKTRPIPSFMVSYLRLDYHAVIGYCLAANLQVDKLV